MSEHGASPLDSFVTHLTWNGDEWQCTSCEAVMVRHPPASEQDERTATIIHKTGCPLAADRLEDAARGGRPRYVCDEHGWSSNFTPCQQCARRPS